MPALAKRRSRSARTLRPRGARIEQLEPRLVLYAVSGYQWTSPNVSFSFVPDGTNVEGYSNTLFSKLNAIAPTDVWQREFARALQTWANVTNLNFHEVADSGLASGTTGAAQGDSRFGDIRLAAHALSGPLAYAYYPSGYYTITGDIFLATEFNFKVGTTYDLYSVLLHEAGHSLGLQHASGSVMNASYQGVRSGLTADDIAGIQAIYGARRQDSYDAAGNNDQQSTASVLTLGSDGKAAISADLQSLADVDYYAFAAPQTSDGSFTVSVSAAGLSLLAPKVSVYNSAGVLLGSSSAGAAYGSAVQVSLSGVQAGETLYVMADGATADAFGMGGYQLQAAFGVTTTGGGDPPPPTGPVPDRYEANDAIAAATNLGKFNSKTVTDVTLHSATDVDYYKFAAQKSGTFQVTARFDAGSASQITVYSSTGSVLAQSSSGSVSVSLATGASAFVKVSSPAGETGVYDLVFARIGGGTKSPSGRLQADGYYADADSAAEHEHAAGHDDLDAGTGVGGLAAIAAAATPAGTAVSISQAESPQQLGLDQAAVRVHAAAFVEAAASPSRVTTSARLNGERSPVIEREADDAGELSDEWTTSVDGALAVMA